jgi:GTP-binding protein
MPEVAFSGRSNVGKSSLINALLKRRAVAKISSTPGRTQSVNFIEINNAFFFVDLPGYGYAKVPISVKKKWLGLIEGYIKSRPSLCLMILIIDSRREPSEDEAQFIAWLTMNRIPFIVVMTKIDKLKRNLHQKSLNSWQKYLKIDKIFLFSSLTGEGKEKVWREIDHSLKNNL